MNDIELKIEECYILVDKELYKQIINNVYDFELKIVRTKRVRNMYELYKSRKSNDNRK